MSKRSGLPNSLPEVRAVAAGDGGAVLSYKSIMWLKVKSESSPKSSGAAGEGGTALSMVIVHVEGESQRPN